MKLNNIFCTKNTSHYSRSEFKFRAAALRFFLIAFFLIVSHVPVCGTFEDGNVACVRRAGRWSTVNQ